MARSALVEAERATLAYLIRTRRMYSSSVFSVTNRLRAASAFDVEPSQARRASVSWVDSLGRFGSASMAPAQ